MANTQGIASTFKAEAMSAIHALGTTVIRAATTPDTVKAALYLASASIGPGTATYTPTGEVTGTGYTAGGVAVTNATAPSVSGTSGIWTPSASISFPTVTLTSAFDCFLLYNSTQGNKAIGSYTIGSNTITAGTFTISMPVNDAANALVRIG